MSEEQHNAGGAMPEEQQQQQPQSSGEVFKVFVKGQGIGSTADKQSLESAFARFGEVKSVWISSGDRGFCFVEMTRKEDAEAAVQSMSGQEVNGVRITAEMARHTAPGGRRGFSSGGGGASGGGGGGGGEFSNSKPGDWVCRHCGINNFARRDRCFKCNAERSYGGGGYDRDDRRRQRGRSRDRDYRRYDDRREQYDERRGAGGYDDRRAYDDRRGVAAPYEDRRVAGGYEDRAYEERRGGGGAGYEDRRGGGAQRPYDDRAGGRGRSKSR